MPSQTNVTLPRLWLASQSPRRSELLTSLGLKFEILVSNAEEIETPTGSVEVIVIENASRKAEAVLKKISGDSDIVISADTLVAMGDRIFSKPENREQALTFLKAYSGTSHQVLTGLVLTSRKYGTRKKAVQTKVFFRTLTQEEMSAYVESGEPYDKAGGYGIQGAAGKFVSKFEGSYSNVMGLPTEVLLEELAALSGIPSQRWTGK